MRQREQAMVFLDRTAALDLVRRLRDWVEPQIRGGR